MVRFTGAELVFVAGCDPLRCLAHRAFWACAILRREAADTIRVARVPFRDTPEPLRDSILSDHFKSGQRLSLQNRPTGLAVQD